MNRVPHALPFVDAPSGATPDDEAAGFDLDEMIAVLTGPAEIAAQSYPLIATAADRLTDALGAYEERTNAKH